MVLKLHLAYFSGKMYQQVLHASAETGMNYIK